MEQTKSISALLSIDGYKAVAVLSLAAVGIYTAIKLVDKLCGASVVINADNRKVEGYSLTNVASAPHRAGAI